MNKQEDDHPHKQEDDHPHKQEDDHPHKQEDDHPHKDDTDDNNDDNNADNDNNDAIFGFKSEVQENTDSKPSKESSGEKLKIEMVKEEFLREKETSFEEIPSSDYN